MPDDIERFVRKQGKPAFLSEHAALPQCSAMYPDGLGETTPQLVQMLGAHHMATVAVAP